MFKLIFILVVFIFIAILINNHCCDFIKSKNYFTQPVVSGPKSKNNDSNSFTDSKKDNVINDNIYINNHGNRKILNPDEYLNMVERLLNDLSKNEFNCIEAAFSPGFGLSICGLGDRPNSLISGI